MQRFYTKSKLDIFVQFSNSLKSIIGVTLTLTVAFVTFSFTQLPKGLVNNKPIISDIQQINGLGKAFTAPQWDKEDDTKILLTQKGFKGLYYFDSSNNEMIQLSNDYSAGYKYYQLTNDLIVSKFSKLHQSEKTGFRRTEGINIFSLKSNGKSIFSREYNSSRVSLPKPFIKSEQWKIPIIVDGKNNIVEYDISDIEYNHGFFNENLVYYSNQGITISVNGKEKLITSQYGIDPTISPNGEYLCFNDSGVLKILDKELNLMEIGIGVNASWSPDSKKLVFQMTLDDGQSITSSDLYSFSIEGEVTNQLTNTPNVLEEYPSISHDGNKIVFTDIDRGTIYVGNLIF